MGAHISAEISYFDISRILLILYNDWFPFMNVYEIDIVLFIFYRTLHYKKTEERIPYKHFLEGVEYGGVDAANLRPVRVRRKALAKYLKVLQKRKMIKIEKKNGRIFYSINYKLPVFEIAKTQFLYKKV